jgi:leucine dehydrogenase
MWPYGSWNDAIFDVLRLSRGMTYKSAVADTGLGGGKSVIIGNPKTDKSEKLFKAMGRFVDSLEGRYITAEDVGTAVEDMVTVRSETKWVTGLPIEMGSSGDPSPWTALGVFRGMKACLEEVFGSGSFEGRTVSLQGCGHVGKFLAGHLAEAGAKLYLSDISADKAKEVAKATGGEIIDAAQALSIPCDVLAPCALGAVVNDETMASLHTKIIAGAANNILLREEHGLRLKEAKILYAPDYVINAGGIINVSIEVEGKYDPERSRKKVENIYTALKRVFAIAKEQNISTNEASNRLAEERLAQGRRAAANA